MTCLFIRSPDHMHRLGEAIARAAPEGTTLALTGDLGAGKTCLAQGVGAGLAVRGPVTSPTFQMMAIYEGPGAPLTHVDLYRLGDASELFELGLEERLGRSGVTIVEWAERFPEVLPADRLEVTITFAGPDARHVQLRATGPGSATLLERLGDLREESP